MVDVAGIEPATQTWLSPRVWTNDNNYEKSHRTVSPKSLANLRPFKRGKEWNGNAGGRPKSKLQSEAYRAELVKENKSGRTNAELIAARMVQDAKKGQVSAAKHVAEYVEGSPRQAFDVNLSIMDELADRINKARQRVKK
jgi:hypothetical protein